MVKRISRMAALLIALCLALTGCSMIEVDREMDDNEVVIKVNDVELLKKDVMQVYENYKAQLEYQVSLYSYYGYNVSMPSEDTMKQTVIDGMVLQEVRSQKAAELGLDQLTEEELAEVQEHAQSDYDSALDQVRDTVTKDGMTDEEITAAAQKYLEDLGITLDDYIEEATDEKISDKLDEYIYSFVEVTDDDVTAEFETRAAADKASYDEDDTAIDTKLNSGSTVYWYPEGYRSVKHILVNFIDEDNTAISDLNSQISEIQSTIDSFATPEPTEEPEVEETEAEGETEAEPEVTEAPAEETEEETEAEPTEEPTPAPTMDPTLPDQLAALELELEVATQNRHDNIQDKVNEIYAKIDAGEDFEALIEEYGEDPGMTTEPGLTNGYVLGENVTRYVTAFHDAAMALQNVGDVTATAVESTYGDHIIKYMAEIPEGNAELTEYLKGLIYDELLSEKQEAELDARNDEWKNAAKIETHIDRMVAYN